jgi:hypothetical protein
MVKAKTPAARRFDARPNMTTEIKDNHIPKDSASPGFIRPLNTGRLWVLFITESIS